jgi:hypothetical protein
MADLNEEVKTVVRKTWDRSNKVRIDNEYGKTPVIMFEIETATIDDGVLTGTRPKSILKIEFDPNEFYPLLNPRDDSILSPDGGNHTMLQIQVYSLFKHRVSQG